MEIMKNGNYFKKVDVKRLDPFGDYEDSRILDATKNQ